MPELRKDPILDRWVLLAENRGGRPNEFAPGRAPAAAAADCPFCEGNEDRTPPEVLAYRDPGTRLDEAGWRVRVVPNKYPALDLAANRPRSASSLFEVRPGLGGHEVIIESPVHRLRTGELLADNLAEVLLAVRDRLRYWRDTAPGSTPLWFKNVGAGAGATIAHLHSQLIVLPLVPVLVRDEIEGALAFYRQHGCCPFCEMIRRERDDGRRLVCADPRMPAFCPFASRFALETWIVPQDHASHFETLDATSIRALAAVLRYVLARVESLIDPVAYNVVLHTAPFAAEALAHYHWHVEILPRLAHAAGFEWGSGFAVNQMSPETAAAEIRREQF